MSGERSVTDRFFAAYDELRRLGRVKQSTLCQRLGVDRRNFDKQAADHERRILRPEWLAVLVLEHGVSADWLLTGRGGMFSD